MKDLTPEERNQIQDTWLQIHAMQLRRRNRLNIISTILLIICVCIFLIFLAEKWHLIILHF